MKCARAARGWISSPRCLVATRTHVVVVRKLPRTLSNPSFKALIQLHTAECGKWIPEQEHCLMPDFMALYPSSPGCELSTVHEVFLPLANLGGGKVEPFHDGVPLLPARSDNQATNAQLSNLSLRDQHPPMLLHVHPAALLDVLHGPVSMCSRSASAKV